MGNEDSKSHSNPVYDIDDHIFEKKNNTEAQDIPQKNNLHKFLAVFQQMKKSYVNFSLIAVNIIVNNNNFVPTSKK